jgi:seryl-tRNA synthetase
MSIVTAARPVLADIETALYHAMGPRGVKARTGLHETVLEALGGFINRQRPQGAETWRFPPVMSRAQIEKAGYLKSFPNLLGCVCCLEGSEADIRRTVARFADGESWIGDLQGSDVVLTPAGCYPIYPIAAARGAVPDAGWTFDVGCDCFRREPSDDLDRLQSFRMREFVRVGSAEQVQAFRQGWLDRVQDLADALGLPWAIDVANDPFFGRGAPLLAASQRGQSLKFELLIPTVSEERPTACMSFNYHQDQFGQSWGLKREDGDFAHTGCVAFGMDRLTLALFVHHGVDLGRWPAPTRQALAL